MLLAKNNVSDGVALTTAGKSVKAHKECYTENNILNYSLKWIIIFNHNLYYILQKTSSFLLCLCILLHSVVGSCQLFQKKEKKKKQTKKYQQIEVHSCIDHYDKIYLFPV